MSSSSPLTEDDEEEEDRTEDEEEEEEPIYVYTCTSNEGRTNDGIVAGGDRVANEIRRFLHQIVNKHRNLNSNNNRLLNHGSHYYHQSCHFSTSKKLVTSTR